MVLRHGGVGGVNVRSHKNGASYHDRDRNTRKRKSRQVTRLYFMKIENLTSFKHTKKKEKRRQLATNLSLPTITVTNLICYRNM